MEKKLSKYVLVVLYLLFVLTGVLFVINDYKLIINELDIELDDNMINYIHINGLLLK